MKDALEALGDEGVIAFPTETVYGLGADPRSERAVNRIYRLKGRPYGKPLLLVASSFAQVRKVAVLREMSLVLAKKYWPGPLTLVLPAVSGVGLAKEITPNGEVAIRIPSSGVARGLARRFGFPIVATSANLSGEPECRTAEEVARVFGGQLDAVVDGGRCLSGRPSTVARVGADGRLEVLREGAIRFTRRDGHVPMW